jgi:hypothetical protein
MDQESGSGHILRYAQNADGCANSNRSGIRIFRYRLYALYRP